MTCDSSALTTTDIVITIVGCIGLAVVGGFLLYAMFWTAWRAVRRG